MVFTLTTFGLFNNLSSITSATAHGKTIFAPAYCGVTFPTNKKKKTK